tara:strand:+ start:654 stop:830 length:177 start_codon:yes stop_codon:yes gene_type:complete
MHLTIFALASSEWGIARFTTDSFALIALSVLVSLPIQLLKDKADFKNIWTSGNALSRK